MDGALLAAIIVLSITPPFLFALYIRARENYDREPLPAVIGAFIWGGTLGVAVALVLHLGFQFGYGTFGSGLRLSAGAFATVVAAPIVEELAKGLGLSGVRRHMVEPEDGLIYGTALGLGFAATENLVYGWVASAEGGAELAITTIILRSVSSTVLHASATALVGYGLSRVLARQIPAYGLLTYYLGAVALHSAFNGLVSYNVTFGLLWAILLVVTVMGWARKKIETLDASNPH